MLFVKKLYLPMFAIRKPEYKFDKNQTFEYEMFCDGDPLR